MLALIGQVIIALFLACVPAAFVGWVADKFTSHTDPMGGAMMVILLTLLAYIGSVVGLLWWGL
ncbi:MAG: hypothetical protein FH759_04735 [Sediminimonas qiaohouensis]|uniref:Uncharacterized protein n=1 Tax=Sediminimonas qiaohouensis TaxID=552061 RepID=A0A7C9HAE2_9RHOB|nr:hypothetical protein [Sediminimonas qiaohouensis]MTJ03990.1 hypothetical protein [Sediminimonas qiaohouensis]